MPERIIACASPSATISQQYPSKTPEQVLPLFLSLGVKAVIRLNEGIYNKQVFERAGIQVFEMEFPDGSCPDNSTIDRFIRIVSHFDSLGQAVAVHCRAGLGRTGTIIGCYLAQKYRILDSKALIAWMRMCRPGMVVGDQQQFLDYYIGRLAHQNTQKSQPFRDKVNTTTMTSMKQNKP